MDWLGKARRRAERSCWPAESALTRWHTDSQGLSRRVQFERFHHTRGTRSHLLSGGSDPFDVCRSVPPRTKREEVVAPGSCKFRAHANSRAADSRAQGLLGLFLLPNGTDLLTKIALKPPERSLEPLLSSVSNVSSALYVCYIESAM